MRISLQFGYTSTVETATRNTVDRNYVEPFEFDIPAVEKTACPVVMRGPGFLNSGQTAIEARRPGEPLGQRLPVRDFVLFDGGVFEPLEFEEFDFGVMGSVVHPLTIETPNAQKRVLANFHRLKPIAAAIDVKLPGPPKPKTVMLSGRERALETMDEMARGLISIDGQIYSRLPELRYVAGEGYVSCRSDYSRDNLPDTFGLNELQDAVKRAAILGQKTDSEVLLPPVEIVDTSWIPERSDLEIALMTAAFDLEKSVAQRLDEMPLDVVLAFDDLRTERYRRYREHDRQERLPAMIQTLCEALAASSVDNSRGAWALDVVRVHKQRLGSAPEMSPTP